MTSFIGGLRIHPCLDIFISAVWAFAVRIGALLKDVITGTGCGSPRYVYGWDRILKDANELLEEGWLYK